MQVEYGESNVSVPVARSLPYVIESVATVVAQDISSEEWAARVRIPNRKIPGKLLGGEDITRITGVERKAWDPSASATSIRSWTPCARRWRGRRPAPPTSISSSS